MSQDKERKSVTITCPHCGHNVPDGKEICMYCGAAQGEEVVNAESKMDMIGGDIHWSFSLDKSRRPIHLSPVIQALIFLVSAAIGGFLVFLMG
jgi:ribosomal protein L32